MACVTACPSGVRYDKLIEGARPMVEEQRTRSLGDRLYRSFLFALFPYPARLEWAARGLRIAQALGLQRILGSERVAKLLPRRAAALVRLAPPAQPHATDRLPSVVPASGPRRLRVGMLLGCVQRVFFPEVNAATVRVLAAEGCEVHIPPRQGCCGALMLHAGRVDDARAFARELIDAFDRLDVDHIVINAAGCGSAMKEYGDLLRDDVAYAARARAFAKKCVDVSELLAQLEPRATRHPVAARVAYHDACHLQHAQKVKQPPRDILNTIPGLTVHEIPEGDLCCGSAGVYNLLEPDAAVALRDRKTANVRQTGADVLVSSNPGCLLQIASGLEQNGHPMRTMHLVELVDASIRGVSFTRAQR